MTDTRKELADRLETAPISEIVFVNDGRRQVVLLNSKTVDYLLVEDRDFIVSALRAHAEAGGDGANRSEATPSANWPTDEQVWDCVRLTFSEAIAAKLSFKRWKDGIDIDVPTHEAMSFARQLFAMGYVASTPTAGFADPIPATSGAMPSVEDDQLSLARAINDALNKLVDEGDELTTLKIAAVIATLPEIKSLFLTADGQATKSGGVE